MLYFHEIFYRFFFICYSYIFNLILFFLFKEELIFFCVIPTLGCNFSVEYFLFTSPSEIFFFILSLNILFSLFFLLPFFLWSVLDFLKAGLYIFELENIQVFLLYYLCFFLCINAFFYFFLFPLLWNFFISFTFKDYVLVDFHLELKAFEYYFFLINFLASFNIAFFLIFVVIIFFFTKKFYYSLTYKSLFYLLFLLISTLFTPPDFLSQLLLFLFFVALFEFVLFVFFLFYFYYYLINYNEKSNISS